MRPAPSLPRVALVALAIAAPGVAAAQMPPPDFPPLPLLPGGAPSGTPAPGATPGPGAVPTPPGKPITPPTAAPLAPGYPYYTYYSWPVPKAESTESPFPPLPPRRRYHTGLFAGGVTAVVAGMTSVLVGAYLVSSAADRIEIYCDMPSIPCAHKDDGPRLTGGAIMMALGAALAAAGLPMWFVGSRFVTVSGEEKKPALRPQLSVGAGSASLGLRF